MSIVTHQGVLPDSSEKADVYAILDNAIVGGIVNSDIDASAAIADTKLATIITNGKVDFSALTIASQTKGDILYSLDGLSFTRLPIGSIGQKLRCGLELDNMEYATNAAAQAAYVTNSSPTYTVISTGGTASASSETTGFEAVKAFDGVFSNYWRATTTNAAILQYTLAVSKIATRYSLDISNGVDWETGRMPKDWTFEGYNGATWDVLDTQTGVTDWSSAPNVYTFTNTTSYIAYRINVTAVGVGGSFVAIGELIISSPVYSLYAYSEGTIKTQGSYSLKSIATITDSLNKTLTRTVSPTIDLSNIKIIRFDIRASRVGANIKVGIHSGTTTTEKTYTVVTANTWETVPWDISAVTNANKNAIDSIIITVLNADATNTFYIDNFFGVVLRWVTP